MADLVERLKESAKDWVDCGTHCDLELEAAAEIERLRGDLNIARLERDAKRWTGSPDDTGSNP